MTRIITNIILNVDRLPIMILLLVSATALAQVADYQPQSLQEIDVIEHLGDTLPWDIKLVNANGDTILLGDYMNNEKPLILSLAYYECPMLCTMVLNGLSDSADKLEWRPGEDYQILTVSIDPDEGTELAAGKEKVYLDGFKNGVGEDAWRFHVTSQDEIDRLAAAVGFKYYYDEEADEYAHPAVVMLLTPEGKIARYLYGLNYPENDLKLGLLEASNGRIGNSIDRLLLYCYQYDSQAGSYSIQAANVMRLGGAATVLILGGFLSLLWWWDRQHRRRLAPILKERRNE